MSRFDGQDAGVPQERDESLIEAMPTEEPRRAASLTLRTDEDRESRAVSLEAANKSLADALRITYRLLQFVMAALVVLFVFSGFQQVNQAETGIRVDLGRIRGERLEPGFQFSWPYPIGEIIKVQRGSQTVELDESFWPNLSPEDRRRAISELGSGSGALTPGRDGALLTADQNLAHAQFSVVYELANPSANVRNLDPAFQRSVVRSAVERAAVAVVATIPIEDLLKRGTGTDQSGRRENSVESQVRARAQAALDTIESGLRINQVILRAAIPPLRVRREFDQVQSAQAEAAKQREQALGDRSKRLNEAAGSAHAPLLEMIDQYEAALQTGDRAGAEATLAQIDRVFDGAVEGGRVEVAGRTFEGVRLSGEVASMLSAARQHRSTIVQQAQRQAETFRAKLTQYRASPAVFLVSEWADALRAHLAGKEVEVLWAPPEAGSFEVLLSPDPELTRQKERDRFGADVDANIRLQQGQSR
ncbi:MAG TPA: hypothetical protein DEB06_09005 [Phycisphaerales bacterium]|nr:hypothetical protein [Phycisphaerales bacterium]